MNSRYAFYCIVSLVQLEYAILVGMLWNQRITVYSTPLHWLSLSSGSHAKQLPCCIIITGGLLIQHWCHYQKTLHFFSECKLFSDWTKGRGEASLSPPQPSDTKTIFSVNGIHAKQATPCGHYYSDSPLSQQSYRYGIHKNKWIPRAEKLIYKLVNRAANPPS